MAKNRVILWECDVCKVEGESNSEKKLPDNWAQLNAYENGGHIFELDLCNDCLTAATNGLDTRKDINASQSKA